MQPSDVHKNLHFFLPTYMFRKIKENLFPNFMFVLNFYSDLKSFLNAGVFYSAVLGFQVSSALQCLSL